MENQSKCMMVDHGYTSTSGKANYIGGQSWRGSDWCMVIVIAGWEEQQEKQLDETIRTMLSLLAFVNKNKQHRIIWNDEPNDIHRQKASSIFILTTPSLKNDCYVAETDAATTGTATDTSLLRERLQAILPSSLSLPNIATSSSLPTLGKHQSNLGNIFAILHGAQSILELQVDLLQFHCKRRNFWNDVYHLTAMSTDVQKKKIFQRGGWSDSPMQVGLVGTQSWSPYPAGNLTTSRSTTIAGDISLLTLFHDPAQVQAQQVAHLETIVHSLLGLTSTGSDKDQDETSSNETK
jgi:hypothetical protein